MNNQDTEQNEQLIKQLFTRKMDFPTVILQRIRSKSSKTLCDYPPGIPIPIEVWVLSLSPQSSKERRAVVFPTHVCGWKEKALNKDCLKRCFYNQEKFDQLGYLG